MKRRRTELKKIGLSVALKPMRFALAGPLSLRDAWANKTGKPETMLVSVAENVPLPLWGGVQLSERSGRKKPTQV